MGTANYTIQWPIESGTYGVVQLYFGAKRKPAMLFTNKAQGQLPENHLTVLDRWLRVMDIPFPVVNYQVGEKSAFCQGPGFYGLNDYPDRIYSVVGMGYAKIDLDSREIEFFNLAPEQIKTTIGISKEFILKPELCDSGWKFVVK